MGGRNGFRAGLCAIVAGLIAVTAPAGAFAQPRDTNPFYTYPFSSKPQDRKPHERKLRHTKPARAKPSHAEPAHVRPAHVKPAHVKAPPAEPPEVLTPIALQTPAALPRDVAYGRFIALIRADLAIGDELVKRRDWELAHHHFMFPLEEIYGVIRAELRSYKTPPFDSALKSLARTVAAHSAKRYPAALASVEKSLAAADANLRSRQRNWARFVLEVSVATLKTAPNEYDDAVEKGRIVRPIGYQTARGIVIETERMIDSVAVELAVKNPQALRELRDGMAELKVAFPKTNAPKEPIVDVPSVAATVDRIEAAARKLM